MWLAWVRDRAIGKNIYECKARKVRTQPCAVFFKSDNPLSRKVLPSGRIEEEFEYGPVVGRCRYFYEYEPESGRIVGFRYEETHLYGCRITGA